MRPVASIIAFAIGSFAVVALASSTASARPFTAGVSVGTLQQERDWDGEADGTLDVFGRLGLTSRVSGQLELQRIDGSNANANVRTATALIVVEMGKSGRLVPTIFAGLGIDRGRTDYMTEEGSHIEGGFGLEYRVDGGLVIGADVRLGGRTVEQSGDTVILDNSLSLYAPLLIEGEYKSGRLHVGVRF